MKKSILFLGTLIFSFNVYAKPDKDIEKYQGTQQVCEESFKQEARKSETTADQLDSAHNAVNCYQKLIEQIIDEKYSKNAKTHKEALKNYIKASYALEGEIYTTQDSCYPVCGSLSTVISKVYVMKAVRDLSHQYINTLKALN